MPSFQKNLFEVIDIVQTILKVNPFTLGRSILFSFDIIPTDPISDRS